VTLAPAVFVATQPLTTTAVQLFVVPTSTTYVVKSTLLSNVTGTAATVTIYRVPLGGSVGVGNEILAALSIPANTTNSGFMANMVLAAGESIWALGGTASAVNMTISGYQAT
jgi:hypothetical protein